MISEAVFEDIVRCHSREWQSAAFRVTGNGSDTDDIVQSALLAAWQKRDSFRDGASFSTFIYRIVVNKAIDWVRRQAARARLMQNMECKTPARDFSPLYEAIAQLPENYAETVLLLLNNDMQYDAVARILGCSENLLYTRMHRAKALLEKNLKNFSRAARKTL